MSVEAAPRPVAAQKFTDRFGRRLIGPFLVFSILIAATIPWRSKAYFEGGVDSVVIIKAVLSVAGLGIALLLASGREKRPVRAAPWVFLSLFLVCTVLGAWAQGELIPSGVIAFRVVLLAATVTVLAQLYEGQDLLGTLIASLGTFALLGAVSGIPTLAEGRLAGGLPPLHPNELASTCALIVLWCFWKVLAGRDTWVHLAILAVAFALLVATGSRTPLAAMAIGVFVLVIHATAIRLRTLVIAMVVAPVALWVITATPALSSLFSREDESTAQLTTLSNRTIAWQSALSPKDSPWLEWLGGGLTMKRIEVPGQWWNTQILDSSWISALVQGGLIGLAICILWVLQSTLSTFSSPRSLRGLQLGLISYLAFRGLLESGLFDATTAFLVFFTTVMITPTALRSAVPHAKEGQDHVVT